MISFNRNTERGLEDIAKHLPPGDSAALAICVDMLCADLVAIADTYVGERVRCSVVASERGRSPDLFASTKWASASGEIDS